MYCQILSVNFLTSNFCLYCTSSYTVLYIIIIIYYFFYYSQYSTLVQLCKDIVARICSLSNIETLLSSSDHGIDKVVIWRNSVTSAIKKLLTDHPLYPDVVVPFTTSMMQLVSGVSATAWLQQQLRIKQVIEICYLLTINTIAYLMLLYVV